MQWVILEVLGIIWIPAWKSIFPSVTGIPHEWPQEVLTQIKSLTEQVPEEAKEDVLIYGIATDDH